MSETPLDEAWQLYRQVVKERDVARAELDTVRLMALEVMRERDEARSLVRECYELLRGILRADAMLHRDRWEELGRLRDKLRPLGWMPETPALSGDRKPDERCPRCGLALQPGHSCPLCDPLGHEGE